MRHNDWMGFEMIVGERSRVAVVLDILDSIGDWVFGRMYLFINGAVVGNPNDSSVDLKGCLRWMDDLLNNPKDRFEIGLFCMEKEQVFLRLAASVLASEDKNNFAAPPYTDIFSRFHVSQIGMSSMDDVTLLLVKDEQGRERCVWKTAEGELLDAYLDAGEIEDVVSRAALKLRDAISGLRVS
jgi:hypothetical protein